VIDSLLQIELYGNPGTPAGRRRGGRETISFFHNNPDLARKAGFKIRKEIKYPKESQKLAVLIRNT